MKLVIVRHGQTDANAKKLIQGRIDNPLNKLGKKQANEAANVLIDSELDIDIIASSPLSRALETANIIASKLDCKNAIYIEPKLLERDFSPFEMRNISKVFPAIIDTGFTHPHYENDSLLEERVKEGVYNLFNKHKNKTVLLSAHAHVIRATYRLVNPKKYNYSTHYLGNASIHIFKVNQKDIIYLSSLNNIPEK